MDAISCTESDGELYQWYLLSVGVEDAFTFLCTDTVSGSSHTVPKVERVEHVLCVVCVRTSEKPHVQTLPNFLFLTTVLAG